MDWPVLSNFGCQSIRCYSFGQAEERVVRYCLVEDHPTPGKSRLSVLRITNRGAGGRTHSWIWVRITNPRLTGLSNSQRTLTYGFATCKYFWYIFCRWRMRSVSLKTKPIDLTLSHDWHNCHNGQLKIELALSVCWCKVKVTTKRQTLKSICICIYESILPYYILSMFILILWIF